MDDHEIGLNRSLRMDFMSGIFFRVFENLAADENDSSRFKLDIIVNNGAIVYPDELCNRFSIR